ncbi:MAG: M24 family metallopeptidase [Candidatus Aenigmatarchaeota archaeon]
MSKKLPLVLYGNSYENADLYYATEFLISENVLYIETEGRSFLITSEMEKGRAEEESEVDRVFTAKSLGLKEEFEGLNNEERKARIIEEVVEVHTDSEKVKVERDFPLGVYNELTIDVKVTEGPFKEQRALKDGDEVEKIRKVQHAASESIMAAKKVLEESEIKDGKLFYEEEVLTQGRLKKVILHDLLDNNCSCKELIVSSGEESSFPHKTGIEDKVLEPNAPIIIDVFPFNKTNRYHGDMTRTFVKGGVPEEVEDMHEAVFGAQRRALEALKPGVKASEVDKAVCEFLEDRGYYSTRLNGSKEAEFKHSTGHGIGLEVHEKPRIGKGVDYELKEGNVLAIEPGLYRKRGGVRIEDLVVVREDGAEVIGGMNRSLTV